MSLQVARSQVGTIPEIYYIPEWISKASKCSPVLPEVTRSQMLSYANYTSSCSQKTCQL